jgi:hypothetical protein
MDSVRNSGEVPAAVDVSTRANINSFWDHWPRSADVQVPPRLFPIPSSAYGMLSTELNATAAPSWVEV